MVKARSKSGRSVYSILVRQQNRRGVTQHAIVAVCLALGTGSGVQADDVWSGYDFWTTLSPTYMEFGGATDMPPIPADFFCQGGPPWHGVINLAGQTIEPAMYGNASAIIYRPEPAVFPPAPPFTATIPLDMVELRLEGTEPILVQCPGGDTLFDVFVALDPDFASNGQMEVEQTDAAGGVYRNVSINVIAQFWFTPAVGDASAGTGLPPYSPDKPLLMEAPGPHRWEHQPPGDTFEGSGPNFYPSDTMDNVMLWEYWTPRDDPIGRHPVKYAQSLTGCCYPQTGCVCADVTENECSATQGIPQPTLCAGTGRACCLTGGASWGTCVMYDPVCCDDCGGIEQGSGRVCAGSPPGTHREACCQQDDTCYYSDPICCDDIPPGDGQPAGPTTDCVDSNGDDTADSCAGCGDDVCNGPIGENQCNCPEDCGNPPGTETPNTDCQDGIDNDCDGPIDCADPDCAVDPACRCGNSACDPDEDVCSCPLDCGVPAQDEVPNLTCQDNLDNDCDGPIDCDDHPDCDNDPGCLPPPDCEPDDTKLACRPAACLDPNEVCVPVAVGRIEPDPFFPPEGIDVLPGTGGMIEIEDSQGATQTYPIDEASATMVIQRAEPADEGTNKLIEAEIIELELTSGNGGGAGGIVVHLSGEQPSTVQVIGASDPTTDYPADSFLSVYVDVDLPDIGLYGLTHQDPIHLQSLGITGIPPWDAPFETPPDWTGVELWDATGRTGWWIHRVVHILPPAPSSWEVTACACNPADACHVVLDVDGEPNYRCEGACPNPEHPCRLAGTDVDGDGTDDEYTCECGCAVPEPVLPDPCVPDAVCGARNRYLGWRGGTSGESEAVRVKADIGFGEKIMWVGEPTQVCELSGEDIPCPERPEFWAAPLQCTPYFTDWTPYDSIKVFGQWIIPGRSYEIALAREGCENDPLSFTDTPLVINTGAWGDIVGIYEGGNCQCKTDYDDCWTRPNCLADFDDITSTVDKFVNLPGAPQKSRTDICPCAVDLKVDFGDIPCVVDGFRGLPYPCSPPNDPCP